MELKDKIGKMIKCLRNEEGMQTLYDFANILKLETEDQFWKAFDSKIEKLIKLKPALELIDGFAIDKATDLFDKNVMDKYFGEDWFSKYHYIRIKIADILEAFGDEINESLKKKEV